MEYVEKCWKAPKVRMKCAEMSPTTTTYSKQIIIIKISLISALRSIILIKHISANLNCSPFLPRVWNKQ